MHFFLIRSLRPTTLATRSSFSFISSPFPSFFGVPLTRRSPPFSIGVSVTETFALLVRFLKVGFASSILPVDFFSCGHCDRLTLFLCPSPSVESSHDGPRFITFGPVFSRPFPFHPPPPPSWFPPPRAIGANSLLTSTAWPPSWHEFSLSEPQYVF